MTNFSNVSAKFPTTLGSLEEGKFDQDFSKEISPTTKLNPIQNVNAPTIQIILLVLQTIASRLIDRLPVR